VHIYKINERLVRFSFFYLSYTKKKVKTRTHLLINSPPVSRFSLSRLSRRARVYNTQGPRKTSRDWENETIWGEIKRQGGRFYSMCGDDSPRATNFEITVTGQRGKSGRFSVGDSATLFVVNSAKLSSKTQQGIAFTPPSTLPFVSSSIFFLWRSFASANFN